MSPIPMQHQTFPAEGLALTWDPVPGTIRYAFIVGIVGAPVPSLETIMGGQAREFALLGIPARFTGAALIGATAGEERQVGLLAYMGDGSSVPVPNVQYHRARQAPRDRQYHPLLPPTLVATPRPAQPDPSPDRRPTPLTPLRGDPWAALDNESTAASTPPPVAASSPTAPDQSGGLPMQQQRISRDGLSVLWDPMPEAIRYGLVIGMPGMATPTLDAIMRGASRQFAVLGIPARFSGATVPGPAHDEDRQFCLIGWRSDGTMAPVSGVRFAPARSAPRDRDYHALATPTLEPAPPRPIAAPPGSAPPATSDTPPIVDPARRQSAEEAFAAMMAARQAGMAQPPTPASPPPPPPGPVDPWDLLGPPEEEPARPIPAAPAPEPVAQAAPQTPPTAPTQPADPWDLLGSPEVREDEGEEVEAPAPIEIPSLPDPWDLLIEPAVERAADKPEMEPAESTAGLASPVPMLAAPPERPPVEEQGTAAPTERAVPMARTEQASVQPEAKAPEPVEDLRPTPFGTLPLTVETSAGPSIREEAPAIVAHPPTEHAEPFPISEEPERSATAIDHDSHPELEITRVPPPVAAAAGLAALREVVQAVEPPAAPPPAATPETAAEGATEGAAERAAVQPSPTVPERVERTEHAATAEPVAIVPPVAEPAGEAVEPSIAATPVPGGVAPTEQVEIAPAPEPVVTAARQEAVEPAGLPPPVAPLRADAGSDNNEPAAVAQAAVPVAAITPVTEPPDQASEPRVPTAPLPGGDAPADQVEARPEPERAVTGARQELIEPAAPPPPLPPAVPPPADEGDESVPSAAVAETATAGPVAAITPVVEPPGPVIEPVGPAAPLSGSAVAAEQVDARPEPERSPIASSQTEPAPAVTAARREVIEPAPPLPVITPEVPVSTVADYEGGTAAATTEERAPAAVPNAPQPPEPEPTQIAPLQAASPPATPASDSAAKEGTTSAQEPDAAIAGGGQPPLSDATLAAEADPPKSEAGLPKVEDTVPLPPGIVPEPTQAAAPSFVPEAGAEHAGARDAVPTDSAVPAEPPAVLPAATVAPEAQPVAAGEPAAAMWAEADALPAPSKETAEEPAVLRAATQPESVATPAPPEARIAPSEVGTPQPPAPYGDAAAPSSPPVVQTEATPVPAAEAKAQEPAHDAARAEVQESRPEPEAPVVPVVTSEDVWLTDEGTPPSVERATPAPPPIAATPPVPTGPATLPPPSTGPLPASLVALLEEAELYLLPAWADYAEVARLLDQVDQEAPNHIRVRELRTRLHEAQQSTGDGDVAALLEQAEGCIARQDYWGAVDLYEQALARQPEHEAARQGIERARMLARWSAQLTGAAGDPVRLDALGDEYAGTAPDLARQAYAAAFAASPRISTLRGLLLALLHSGDGAGVAPAARGGVQTLQQIGTITATGNLDTALATLARCGDPAVAGQDCEGAIAAVVAALAAAASPAQADS